MTATVYLNGKFLAQRTTGVQRVARELLRALDERAAGLPGQWTLLHPAGVAVPPLARVKARALGPVGRGLHRWEQLDLPRAARDGLLVNLAGSAPYLARRQACMIHDAAVYDHPGAYSRAFVLWYRLLFRHLARSAERLLTVSGFSRDRLALALGLSPERLQVVPGGAEHLQAVTPDDAVRVHHALVGQSFVLAVASANPTKNLEQLIRAFAALPEHLQARLVIVGGDNSRVFRPGRPMADAQRVVRVGTVDDAGLKSLYLHASALAFPSIYEGFGLPALEAMACGCPVIAARAGALPQVCGEAAMYVDPQAVGDLTRALHTMLADGTQSGHFRNAGRARAKAFTWAASADALLQALAPSLGADLIASGGCR